MVTRQSASSAFDGRSDEPSDAIELLSVDRRNVEELFEEYESTKDEAGDDDKEQKVAAICLALTVHASVEEEIFYPAAREALGGEDIHVLDEAEVKHASIKDLIAQLSEMNASEPLYDAKVKVLSEYVKHHVQEEEGEMFPALRDTDLAESAM